MQHTTPAIRPGSPATEPEWRAGRLGQGRHGPWAVVLVDGDEGEHRLGHLDAGVPARGRRQAATLSFIDVRPTEIRRRRP